ncbi:MAG TPA: ribonuclease HII [Sphingobium sp.]|jgi:ribonuclease HII|uniref:ribonuclease HII n=1 Tax=unclassified Sphingobium TaxID=2611147 RepID=UPI0007F391AD|nr:MULTISPECIES: ribonuclease HII [unclassified Sphingobium]OAN59210.1 ribonuclease HII [Sphingobium sp. TCM1]WIW89162.1 ribonuclease HII [Sphingobium sp. V4]HAF40865.1 ribonuclease HII [Sphingobium sp.]
MPDFAHERRYHPGLVAGVDEAGRGPLAGPVVAAAVILRAEDCPDGLNDSKQLSATKRAALEAEIKARALCWGVGLASVAEIDEINILWATMLAMTRAVEALSHDCAHVLVDGNRCPQWRWASTAIVAGDAKSLSIAAASILAKEERDRMMIAAAAEHPHYGWETNKGYGSARHLAALREHGPTPLHRRSFAPVAQLTLL